ncbi:MAG: response regulator transcription factor [Bacteroidales bacterium]|nr:response regulator transcription factor [Bacteroidales bacterium]MDT8432176.1 response regulator transcription factor [Bacteroidales bacterium]
MNSPTQTILLVDDEQDILEFLTYNLRQEGFFVHTASNGRIAIEKAIQLQPDVILLDVMMPEMDGIEVCEVIRRTPKIRDTRIAMLSARSESYSQIAGLEAGADDYMVKPIRPKVLVSRIKALLKRSDLSKPGEVAADNTYRRFGNLSIDIGKHDVNVNGAQLSLPKKEFQLLALLSSRPEKVFTREEIYNHVWGDEVVVSDRTIDVYIRKLREKIGQERITTIKSVGYRFEG